MLALIHIATNMPTRLLSVSMFVRRILAFAVIVAAAVALGWASSRASEPTDSSSDRPSASIHHGPNTADPAVLESTTSSFVGALAGDRPSQPQLPWELLKACGLAGIALAVSSTRCAP